MHKSKLRAGVSMHLFRRMNKGSIGEKIVFLTEKEKKYCFKFMGNLDIILENLLLL